LFVSGKFSYNRYEKFATCTQSRIFSDMREKLFKTCHKYKFSDVIAIAGNQGHFLPVSREKLPERCVKIRCPQNLAKLHGQIAIKIVIF
jgi:hypothetical protein